MSERYSRLFTLANNLYSGGSPVLIAAGALSKSHQTGRVIAQLKYAILATMQSTPADWVWESVKVGDIISYEWKKGYTAK